jgi:hypothetical protein
MTDTPNLPPDHPDRLRDEAVEKVLRWKREERQRKREERQRRRYGRRRSGGSLDFEWEE